MIPAMKRLALFSLALLLACSGGQAWAQVPVYGYTVVHSWPHDTDAYTEGLFYLDGHLYEGTGQSGQSFVRKLDLRTGKVLQQRTTPDSLFGEGIVAWKKHLIELTWQSHRGFVYDLSSFRLLKQFTYPGEGWGLTQDGTHLLMSDGTPTIRRLDPDTLRQVGKIDVTADGKPLPYINELEWVHGEIYANVWLTRRIARIDPASGKVVGWIDLSGLEPRPEDTPDPSNDVLNGIAWDAVHDRLFVTGKRWPHIYEIRLTGPHPASH